MSNDPFGQAPFPTSVAPVSTSWNGGAAEAQTAAVEEPRRRGPRREAAPENETPDAPAKRKGRPPKTAAVPGEPLSTASLFQVLAGLQTEDVVPLTSCYETLNALHPEDRSRVLGFLNRVLG